MATEPLIMALIVTHSTCYSPNPAKVLTQTAFSHLDCNAGSTVFSDIEYFLFFSCFCSDIMKKKVSIRIFYLMNNQCSIK